MSTFNIFVLIAFVLGVAALIAGLSSNGKSNFEDGSFLVQMFLEVVGAILIVGALIVKFIASLFG